MMKIIEFNEIELLQLRNDLVQEYKTLENKAEKLNRLIAKLFEENYNDIREIDTPPVTNTIQGVLPPMHKKTRKAVSVIISETFKPEPKIKKDTAKKEPPAKTTEAPSLIIPKKLKIKKEKPVIVIPEVVVLEQEKKPIIKLNEETQASPPLMVAQESLEKKKLPRTKNKKADKSLRVVRLEQSKWRKFNWRTWARSILVANGEQMNFDEMFFTFNKKYNFTGEDFDIARKSLLDGLFKLVRSGEVTKYSLSESPMEFSYGLKRWEKFI